MGSLIKGWTDIHNLGKLSSMIDRLIYDITAVGVTNADVSRVTQ